MIVDSHYHYVRLPADEQMAQKMMAGWLLEGERGGVRREMSETLSIFRDYLNDTICDKLIRRMDESGIDVSVAVVVDCIDYGTNEKQAMRANELCAQAAARHPGRIIPLAGLDPRRPGAPALLHRCIEEFGMKGLKWHPDDGYYPNSKEAYAVLEVAAGFGVPLLSHSGPLPHTKSKYSDPFHLDDVAADFPNIPIIAAHMGDILWHNWAAIAKYKTNIYGDLAMWQMPAVGKPALFRRYLREILDIVGPEQVLFATDGPVFEPVVPNRRWVELMKSLPGTGDDGISFTREEVAAIMGGNAARVFKLG